MMQDAKVCPKIVNLKEGVVVAMVKPLVIGFEPTRPHVPFRHKAFWGGRYLSRVW